MTDELPAQARRLARDLLDAASVVEVVEAAVDELEREAPHLHREALHAALVHALAQVAVEGTRERVIAAREEQVRWSELSEALGLAVSTVRTRFHEPTADARRAYEERRRGDAT